MIAGKCRRFYRQAEATKGEGGFVVRLDGHPLKTPEGAVLRLGSASLAAAIAEEWASQNEALDPATMPITQLANTVIDRIAAARAAVVEAVAGYGASDLLCYRAEGPADLVARQEAEWQPLLEWAAQRYGAQLAVATGVIHVPQADEALACLRKAVATLDDWELAAAASIVGAVGSAVLTLALVSGHLDAAAVCAHALLDEDWQCDKWGADVETLRRRQAILGEIAAAERFLVLARDQAGSATL